MEKKRSRVITGWRQVAAKPKLVTTRRYFSPLYAPAPAPRANPPQSAANERWEAEGGNTVEPEKK